MDTAVVCEIQQAHIRVGDAVPGLQQVVLQILEAHAGEPLAQTIHSSFQNRIITVNGAGVVSL